MKEEMVRPGGETTAASSEPLRVSELREYRVLVVVEALKIAIQLAEQIQHGDVTPLGGAKLIADNSRATLRQALGEEQ